MSRKGCHGCGATRAWSPTWPEFARLSLLVRGERVELVLCPDCERSFWERALVELARRMSPAEWNAFVCPYREK